MARSGRSASVARHGLGAVGGLADDLDLGLAVEQQAQPAADDAVVVGDQDSRRHRCRSQSQLDRRPAAAARSAPPKRPAGEHGALAHALQPDAVGGRAGRRSRRRRRAARTTVSRPSGATSTRDVARRRRGGRRSTGPPGRRGRRRSARRRRASSRPAAGSRRSSASRPARRPNVVDLRAQGGAEPEVVERRRAAARGRGARAPPSPAWRPPGSRAARRAAPAGRCWAVASRRSRTPVSAWLASSWRSRARRARSLLLGRAARRWRCGERSASRRSSMRSKARVQARDLLDVRRRHRAARSPPGPKSTSLHRGDQRAPAARSAGAGASR